MLDKLHQKRAVLVLQEQQLTANLNHLVNQVNMTRGAIAILDEVIGEAQAEEAVRQAETHAAVSEQDMTGERESERSADAAASEHIFAHAAG